MPSIKVGLMAKTEYHELCTAINDGTKECPSCSSLDTELNGGHDYDYKTKVAVRFHVDLQCRKCGFSIRVIERVTTRNGIPLLQPDSENALQFVDLVNKPWERG